MPNFKKNYWMSNNELLDYTGEVIYLPIKIPGQTDKRLVRINESSLDVFSYEIYPKLLSTTAVKLNFNYVYRFFFDYDKDLSGVPFIEVYNHEESQDYTVAFKICKIVDGHAIINELEAEENLPGYNDDIGDTDYFKVAPNKILVTHRREELISFSYTKSPLRLSSTREYTPVDNVDQMFPTNDKNVFCGFGQMGGRRSVFFFYNIKTDEVVDYLKVNGKEYSEVEFFTTGFDCREVIQDLEDQSTFKAFAAEYVFEVKIDELAKEDFWTKDIRRRRNLSKCAFTMFDKEYEWDIEEENLKEVDGDILDKLPCQYGDNMGYLFDGRMLQMTESDYLFWDTKMNFFHFNNVTNKFNVVKKELFKGMGNCSVREVFRDEEEILCVVKGWKGLSQYLIVNRHSIE